MERMGLGCRTAATHLRTPYHPFAVPCMAKGNVEELKCIYEVRLITANKFIPSQVYFAINACHKLHASIIYSSHGSPHPLFCTCYIMRCGLQVNRAPQQQSCKITARKVRNFPAADKGGGKFAQKFAH
eukprot:444424-Pleurochrysis_carterae.AAC.1